LFGSDQHPHCITGIFSKSTLSLFSFSAFDKTLEKTAQARQDTTKLGFILFSGTGKGFQDTFLRIIDFLLFQRFILRSMEVLGFIHTGLDYQLVSTGSTWVGYIGSFLRRPPGDSDARGIPGAFFPYFSFSRAWV